MDWIWDLETYPNAFTFSSINANGEEPQVFEMSTRKNECVQMFSFLDKLRKNKDRMVGFNSLNFDYPIIHDLLSVREKAATVSGQAVATRAYKKAQSLIFDQSTVFKSIKTSEEYVRQVDLFKIHHFDNKARATSLKMIEFNMKSDTIEDLPYDVGAVLADDEIDVLLGYNMHDVMKTLDFYKLSGSYFR